MQSAVVPFVQTDARSVVAVVDDGRGAEGARSRGAEHLVDRLVQMSVEDLHPLVAGEAVGQTAGADETVDPLPGAASVLEGRVVLDDEHRLLRQRRIAQAVGDGADGVGRDLTGRAGDRLGAGDVERQEVHVPEIDDLARRLGGVAAVGAQGTVERTTEGVGGGVGVVIAGDERDPLRIELRLVEHGGERLHLGVGAHLGEVPGDDDVVGSRTRGRGQRSLHLGPAGEGVERPTDADQVGAEVLPPQRGEDVEIGKMRDAPDRRLSGQCGLRHLGYDARRPSRSAHAAVTITRTRDLVRL